MTHQHYRRPPLKRYAGGAYDHLSLRDVGLGRLTQIILMVLSLFPIVGIVMGVYYQDQDHYGTRSFGRFLLAYSVILHFTYFCVLCPFAFYLTVR